MAAIEIQGLEKTYSVGFWRKKPKLALRPLNLKVEDGEILEYYGRLSGVDSKTVSRKASEMLERVGLKDSANVQLRKFSKGMLQRVGIAQAILHGPRVVFFDEPMSGLDPMGRREVRDLMVELKREGKTVFFSTHILSDAEALCDRVAIVHKGELQGVGAVAELTSSVGSRVELIWRGTIVPAALQGLGAECHVTGDTARALIPESSQDAALDALRRERLHLVSVMPVRTSLEDYFVQKLRPAQTMAGSRA
ncbi:MAG: ABC transporter [Acidobacteria bacterium]|nr:MAG: ABC transporter [Acidobacteriota bacterium]